jgi:hypothetical protein
MGILKQSLGWQTAPEARQAPCIAAFPEMGLAKESTSASLSTLCEIG